MRIELMTESEKRELQEMKAAKAHCREIKAHYEKTKGSLTTKREQHTTVPMSFWKLIEKMLTDEKSSGKPIDYAVFTSISTRIENPLTS